MRITGGGPDGPDLGGGRDLVDAAPLAPHPSVGIPFPALQIEPTAGPDSLQEFLGQLLADRQAAVTQMAGIPAQELGTGHGSALGSRALAEVVRLDREIRAAQQAVARWFQQSAPPLRLYPGPAAPPGPDTQGRVLDRLRAAAEGTPGWHQLAGIPAVAQRPVRAWYAPRLIYAAADGDVVWPPRDPASPPGLAATRVWVKAHLASPAVRLDRDPPGAPPITAPPWAHQFFFAVFVFCDSGLADWQVELLVRGAVLTGEVDPNPPAPDPDARFEDLWTGMLSGKTPPLDSQRLGLATWAKALAQPVDAEHLGEEVVITMPAGARLYRHRPDGSTALLHPRAGLEQPIPGAGPAAGVPATEKPAPAEPERASRRSRTRLSDLPHG